MDNIFKIIAITTPEPDGNEIGSLCRLLGSGAIDYLHVRVPSRNREKTVEILSLIPDELHERVTVHYFPDLARLYDLGGIHLQSDSKLSGITGHGNDDCKIGGKRDSKHPNLLRISKSCHSIEELSEVDCYDYVTLSPIFDSISKPGYESRFNPDSIGPSVKGRRVVALGGVTPDKLETLHEAGFYGAAMLGAIPEVISELGEEKFVEHLLAIRERINKKTVPEN